MSRIVFRKAHPVVKKWAVPEIFGKSLIAESIKKQSKMAQEIIKIPLPCTNPSFAFLFRTRFEKLLGLNSERFFINTEDGGVIGIDKVTLGNGDAPDHDKPIVLIFPGGNETILVSKMQTLCSTYLKAGYSEVFVCNYRGKGKTPFKTPQFSLPLGRFNDVHHIVEYMCSKFNRKILLSGDCLGGNFVIDYLTSHNVTPVNERVIGGVIHSVQWNYKESFKIMMTDFNYSQFVKPWAKNTKNTLVDGKNVSEEFYEAILKKIGPDNLEVLTSLSMEEQGDVSLLYKVALSPLCDGLFSDIEEYFQKTAPNLKIGATARPLVVVNAVDDLIAPFCSSDIPGIEEDPNLCLWLFASGGHCSYVKQMFPVTNFIDDAMIECSDIVSQ